MDTTSDPEHCGGCNQDCGVRDCVNSACVCSGGLTWCDPECVDTDNDPNNCGNCDTACGADQSCIDGVCICDAGLGMCDGECFDFQTSLLHCGDCYIPCEAGERCTNGVCTSEPCAPATDVTDCRIETIPSEGGCWRFPDTVTFSNIGCWLFGGFTLFVNNEQVGCTGGVPFTPPAPFEGFHYFEITGSATESNAVMDCW